MVPHSAAIERLWSMMASIHTKSRNRLKLEKVVGAAAVKMQIHKDKQEELRFQAAGKKQLIPSGPKEDEVTLQNQPELEEEVMDIEELIDEYRLLESEDAEEVAALEGEISQLNDAGFIQLSDFFKVD